ELRWPELLGAGVFRLDGWTRRRGDPELYPASGTGGPAFGADEPLALTGHFRGRLKPGPRQRPHPAALSGSQLHGSRQRPRPAASSGQASKAPGFAGGYLLIFMSGSSIRATTSKSERLSRCASICSNRASFNLSFVLTK